MWTYWWRLWTRGTTRAQAQPTAAGLGVRDQAQPAEIHLSQLSRFTLRHPNRRPLAFTEAAVVDGEPMQGAVGNPDPLTLQELPNLGEPEPPLLPRLRSQPVTDRLQVGQQLCLDLARVPVLVGSVAKEHLRCQSLRGRIRSPLPTQALGAPYIASDRLPGMAGDAGYLRPALTSANLFKNCQNLPHGHLSIGHPHTSQLGSGAKMAPVAPRGWV
ncbi:MAG: hypothetical protein MUO50_10260, partial [Longimicrobiales bacterium]|nr:hypothetical protein [Longimicrobiales bacterium]